jgi:protein gp37
MGFADFDIGVGGVSKTSIEWTEMTWNPIVGCSIVSPGCTNCYAMKMAARIEAMGNQPQYAGTTKKVKGNAVWTGKLAQAPDSVLTAPLRRKKPTTYFVNSMGDLFHEDCPDEWIDRVFAVMALSPRHTFQILTKRASRMQRYLEQIDNEDTDLFERVADAGARMMEDGDNVHDCLLNMNWPLPNVWLGVSTERQQQADERIPLLLETPSAIRFISAEPLLGPIDLRQIKLSDDRFDYLHLDSLTGFHAGAQSAAQWIPGDLPAPLPPIAAGLDWVIVGGESGHDARPMHTDWARGLRNQCAAVCVPFFFKQNGEWLEFYDRDREDPDWRKIPRVDNQMGRNAVRWQNLAGGIGFHGERLIAMRNVGKKAAGRLLDGCEHNGFPSVQA